MNWNYDLHRITAREAQQRASKHNRAREMATDYETDNGKRKRRNR